MSSCSDPGQGAIVVPGEKGEGSRSPEQGEEHVPVGIPRVALGTEIGLADIGGNDQGDPPLQELPEGGDGEHDAQDDEIKPPPALKRGLPQQHLADDDGGKNP